MYFHVPCCLHFHQHQKERLSSNLQNSPQEYVGSWWVRLRATLPGTRLWWRVNLFPGSPSETGRNSPADLPSHRHCTCTLNHLARQRWPKAEGSSRRLIHIFQRVIIVIESKHLQSPGKGLDKSKNHYTPCNGPF